MNINVSQEMGIVHSVTRLISVLSKSIKFSRFIDNFPWHLCDNYINLQNIFPLNLEYNRIVVHVAFTRESGQWLITRKEYYCFC